MDYNSSSLELNKLFPSNDVIPNIVYKSLNWNRSIIGGSYALQQFTGDKWKPNDIDIMIKCDDINDFQNEVIRFVNETKGTLIKTRENMNPAVGKQSLPLEEDFHKSILGTATIMVNDCPKPIQLVAIKTEPYDTLLGHLNKITDTPACVSYTVQNNQRIYHIPEKCCEALFTRKVKKNNICFTRMDKYKERGYDFY